jgi:hypothetical protein
MTVWDVRIKEAACICIGLSPSHKIDMPWTCFFCDFLSADSWLLSLSHPVRASAVDNDLADNGSLRECTLITATSKFPSTWIPYSQKTSPSRVLSKQYTRCSTRNPWHAKSNFYNLNCFPQLRIFFIVLRVLYTIYLLVDFIDVNNLCQSLLFGITVWFSGT